MNIIVFIDKVLNRIGFMYRRALINKNALKCGREVKVCGKIYCINPNVNIGNNVTIYPGVQFWGDGDIVIGDNVSIGNYTIIYASKGAGVFIGKDTQIAAQVYIIDMNHGIKKGTLIRKQQNESTPINIGEDVWIAANVVILKGVNIADGAVISANALVNSDIPKEGIAVGVPAKVIKYRN